VRKVIYSMNVSLDGFVAGPNGELDWVIVDEELHRHFSDEARAAGAFLYGRRIYELMARDWPPVDQDPAAPGYMLEFARIWKDKPKIVFSKTLERVAWNSRLVRDNVGEEIARLKAQPGPDVEVSGPTIAASLMRLGLIDEYRPVVHPVVLGRGTPYFPALESAIKLRLVETRRFATGVVYLRYQRSEEEQG
jgi:dihydrofolate reductase